MCPVQTVTHVSVRSITQAGLIEKASGYSSASGVNPLERAALVNRLREPGMTDDEGDEIVKIVEGYLSGRLCAADWRLWLRHREEMERAAARRLHIAESRPWTTSSNVSDGES
jgi:hypothetical protein